MKATCIICGVELKRRPWELRKQKFVCCREHLTAALSLVAKREYEKKKQEAAIKPFFSSTIRPSPATAILIEVATKYGILLCELRARGRGPRYRWYRQRGDRMTMFKIRQEAACRLRNELHLSLNTIGRLLGGREHTSILRMVSETRRQRHIKTTAERVVARILEAQVSP